jgi:hypothetical protein
MSYFRRFSKVLNNTKYPVTIGRLPISSSTSQAEPATFFPNPRDNFSASTEPVISRVRWFQNRPQPNPVKSISGIGRVVPQLKLTIKGK